MWRIKRVVQVLYEYLTEEKETSCIFTFNNDLNDEEKHAIKKIINHHSICRIIADKHPSGWVNVIGPYDGTLFPKYSTITKEFDCKEDFDLLLYYFSSYKIPTVNIQERTLLFTYSTNTGRKGGIFTPVITQSSNESLLEEYLEV